MYFADMPLVSAAAASPLKGALVADVAGASCCGAGNISLLIIAAPAHRPGESLRKL